METYFRMLCEKYGFNTEAGGVGVEDCMQHLTTLSKRDRQTLDKYEGEMKDMTETLQTKYKEVSTTLNKVNQKYEEIDEQHEKQRETIEESVEQNLSGVTETLDKCKANYSRLDQQHSEQEKEIKLIQQKAGTKTGSVDSGKA